MAEVSVLFVQPGDRILVDISDRWVFCNPPSAPLEKVVSSVDHSDPKGVRLSFSDGTHFDMSPEDVVFKF